MSFFNNNLPYIRKQKGISQSDLAEKIGVDQSTISLWEKGMDTTVDNAIKVANALNVPIPEFLGKDLRIDNAEQVNLEEVDTIKIPVLGIIKAGTPIEAQENILDYIEIPKEWTKGGKEFYALKIKGNSMYPKYLPDDIVVFEQTNDMEYANNKDACILVNGFDATFKKFNLNQDGITLTPLNLDNEDNYLPTFYNAEQIQMLPIKVIGIAKRRISDIE